MEEIDVAAVVDFVVDIPNPVAEGEERVQQLLLKALRGVAGH